MIIDGSTHTTHALDLTAVDLKRRSDIHYARKIWHMSTVFGMFLAYTYLPPAVSMGILVACWVVFTTIDVVRQIKPALNDLMVHALRPIMRQTEVNKLAGTTFLLSGVLFVDVLFPRPVVALTLLFLAFADPIASYFGILYGKDKIFGHKSIQGFMAAFFVSAVLSFCFLFFNNYLIDHLVVFCLLAGLVGAFAELIPIGKIDDNFTLPIIAATGLSILFYFFGFFVNVS